MLIVNPINFDLGKVKHGTIASKLISLENPTQEAITVNSLNSSCNCTTGHMIQNPLPPLTTGSFKINFESSKVGLGVFTKSISIAWVHKEKYFTQQINFSVDVSRD